MDHELQRYLNDHLAGSSGALLVIQHLVDTSDQPEARDYFATLKQKVESDQELLERLLVLAGMAPSGVLKVAGNITARFGLMKLMWEGFEPGKLGMFEAIEMIAIGIQGKRLLWLGLREISCWFPEWDGIDFAELEAEAISQRDGVELWRIEEARSTLACVERRAAGVGGKS